MRFVSELSKLNPSFSLHNQKIILEDKLPVRNCVLMFVRKIK